MRKLIYTNERGESVELSSENFRLRELNGIGGADTDIQTQKGAYQDGETYIDTLLEMRDISIELTIVAKDNETIYKLRQKLAQVFNPKLKGELTYKYHDEVRVIDVVPDSSPEFPSTPAPTSQPAIVNLICPDPYWQEVELSGERLGDLVEKMTFPLMLSPTEVYDTTFARRGYEALLGNDGDVDCPVTIIFHGPAENPQINNLTTDEFIKINQTLQSGERLEITTGFGNKRAEIIDDDGNVQNAFHYLDLESTFWQLKPGDNYITFFADVDRDQAAVIIRYRNRYAGI